MTRLMLWPLGLLLLVVFWCAPVVGQDPAKSPRRISVVPSPRTAPFEARSQASDKIAQTLRETRIDFKAEEEPLEKAIQRLSEELSLEIKLDRTAFDDARISPETPITIAVRDVCGDTLLSLILSPIQLSYAIDFSQVLVTTPEEIESRGMISRFYPLRDLLGPEGREVELDYDSLMVVLTTAVVPESWEELGGVGTVSQFGNGLAITQTRQIHQTIEQLFSALRQARALPDDRYEVQPIMAAADWLRYDQTWEELRSTLISVKAEEMPLEALIEHLAGDTGLNFVVDRKSIKDVARIDTLLIDGQWTGKPLDQVLTQILRPNQLTWHIVENVVCITTPEQAEADLQIKVYPLRDLVPPGPPIELRQNPWNHVTPSLPVMGGMCGFTPKYSSLHPRIWDHHSFEMRTFDDMIETLTTTIVPESWEELGGPGTLAEFVWGDCLVVCQTLYLHDDIERLLSQIRAHDEPSEIQTDEQEEDFLLIRSYYVHANPQSGEPLIGRDDLEKFCDQMQQLVSPDSWEDDGVFMQVFDDRVIIRQMNSIHAEVGLYLEATHLLAPIVDNHFGTANPISGFRFDPQPQPHTQPQPTDNSNPPNNPGGMF